MRVAVIGAGVAGLVAAHRLSSAGHVCDVFERWPGLGGQAATLDVGQGHLLERYYHHLFQSDTHITELYSELGMPDELEWLRSSVAFFVEGRQHPFVTPGDLLRFSPLSPASRVRMGAAVVGLQRFGRAPEPYEQITAKDWIRSRMGAQAWDKVWGPLLRGKFGERADDIAMVWLWSKFTLRRSIKGESTREERLGYPRHSWELLFAALRDSIERAGGAVLIDLPAARLDLADGRAGFTLTPGAPGSFRRGHDPKDFEGTEPRSYDAVVATVPNDVFRGLLSPRLADAVGAPYLARLGSIEYFTALCLLLELDRPFSPYYWTNIGDRRLPFVGLVEHTNFIDPARYDGRRFLYVANYLPAGHELLELSTDELLERYDDGLRRVNPQWSRSWIRQAWLFREPAAQPIVDIGYRARMPALATGVPGLFLANTTQVYPEDRGTNYAVRLGGDVAAEVLAAAPHLVSSTDRPRPAVA